MSSPCLWSVSSLPPLPVFYPGLPVLTSRLFLEWRALGTRPWVGENYKLQTELRQTNFFLTRLEDADTLDHRAQAKVACARGPVKHRVRRQAAAEYKLHNKQHKTNMYNI